MQRLRRSFVSSTDSSSESSLESSSSGCGMDNVRNLLQLPLSFWLTTFSIVFFYNALFPFVADASKFIIDVYGLVSLVAKTATLPRILQDVLQDLARQCIFLPGFLQDSCKIYLIFQDSCKTNISLQFQDCCVQHNPKSSCSIFFSLVPLKF